MCLFWGIMPHKVDQLDNPEKLISDVTHWGKSTGMLSAGDRVVYVTGTGLLNNTHNLLVVNEVPAD
jgi:pyruvate kinase